MYRHSPVRNQRSKGLKTKHVVQLCLLLAVCFWLLFQLKRSHDKKKHFDATISHGHDDRTLKFGRKDLHPKLDEAQIQMPDHTQQQQQQQQQDDDDEDNKHEDEEEEEQDEDKIEDGGGGGDDEIDEKSNMEIERDEVDIIDEDKETEESEGEDNEDKDVDNETETESRVEDDGSTHEAREEHYKADDASSAVITHDPENEIQNGTLDDNNSSEDVGLVDNDSLIEEKDSESKNATENPNTTTAFDSNAIVANMTPNLTKNSGMLKPNDEENGSKSENSETNKEDDPTHLEGPNDLETMPEIETGTASE